MKILIVGLLLSLSFSAISQDKKDIENMLNHMQSMGTFTPEQIEEAKKKLNKLSDEDVNNMVNKAQSAAKNPEYQNQAKKVLQNYKKQGGQLPDGKIGE